VSRLTEDLYRFLGQDIAVRSNSKEILAHLKTVYARFYQTGEATSSSINKKNADALPRRIEITDNVAGSGEIVIKDEIASYRLRCKNFDLFENKQSDVDPFGWVQWFVLWTASTLAKNYFFIHAGAVASKKGGMIFPAVSGMGKTTLTIKLVQKGLKFLSDEVACINAEESKMVPFFRKINLTDESRILLGLPPWTDSHVCQEGPDGTKWMVDIEDILADSLASQCTPRFVFFLKGFGEKPRLEHISPSHALFQLLKFPISQVKDPGSQIFTYAPLFNDMQCFNLVMGDLDATAERIINLAEHGE
jgi:hypothetical protein